MRGCGKTFITHCAFAKVQVRIIHELVTTVDLRRELADEIMTFLRRGVVPMFLVLIWFNFAFRSFDRGRLIHGSPLLESTTNLGCDSIEI